VTDRDEAVPHALQCLEIWGGNEPVRTALSVPGLDAWLYSQPANGAAQGGDLYYVSACGAGRISRFVIADVSGHGAEAGTMARTLRGLMRQHINRPDQSKFAQALNREFLRQAGSRRFATALLATYFAPTDQLIVCNAGHPRPIWYQASSGRWQLLDQHAAQEAMPAVPARDGPLQNLPLGVISQTSYVQFIASLGKGDLLLIYTDSFPEAEDSQGRPLGEQGLLRLASQLDPDRPEQLNERFSSAVAGYRAGPASDDQTLLVLHHNAADPPRQSLGQKIRVMAEMLGFGNPSHKELAIEQE
jgi:phosphoserine phosphatase RsbU/P